jgi:hypothetical protein
MLVPEALLFAQAEQYDDKEGNNKKAGNRTAKISVRVF